MIRFSQTYLGSMQPLRRPAIGRCCPAGPPRRPLCVTAFKSLPKDRQPRALTPGETVSQPAASYPVQSEVPSRQPPSAEAASAYEPAQSAVFSNISSSGEHYISHMTNTISAASSQWARYLLVQELSSTLHSPAAIHQRQQQQQTQLQDLLSVWQIPAAALAIFALISFDVNHPTSLQLLPQLDQQLHQLVVSTTSPEWRASAADVLVSDISITAGIWGWLVATAICLRAAPRRTALPLSLCWLAYFSTCGAVIRDPPLVDFFKHFFARARPSDLHHTFSFPSGHTSAAVFIVGALVSILLPLSIDVLRHSKGSPHGPARMTAAAASAIASTTAAAAGAAAPKQQLEQLSQQQQQDVWADSTSASVSLYHSSSGTSEQELHAGSVRGKSGREWGAATWLGLGLWGAAGATTAAGRVLADAHWLSDTLAGGALAVGVVAMLNVVIMSAVKPDQE